MKYPVGESIIIRSGKRKLQRFGPMSAYQRILVPVDGSESSLVGVREAIRLAKDQGARICFIYVVDESAVGLTLEGFVAFNDIIDAFKRSGSDALDTASRLSREGGLDPDAVLLEEFSGRVADAIVDQAQRWSADLIVMGTHGRRGLQHALLGSEAEGVLHKAPVPLLLVRGKA
jgi:nucleotide-binding universal stress UspA family protein